MKRLWIATVILATAGALAACGGDTGGSATGTDEPTLQTADSSLGTILVDGEGRTVYMFTQDSPGTSVCEAECLDAWPPVEGELAAGDGVDGDQIGTIDRGDGTVQATYADWPLYYFAEDSDAGDTAGQGVNEVWYVLNPAGEPVKKAAETEAPSGGGGGGYSMY